MRSFVIYMHESAFNVRKYFNLILELLADIVSFPQRRARIHNDIDLYKIFLVLFVNLSSKMKI